MATDTIEQVAKETFGFEELRPGQREAVEAVVEGRDTLVVMPTGAGKSAIYQIAAVVLSGPTVVVSPLIALQRDQVDDLEDHDAGGAAQANSTLSARERRDTFSDLRGGDLEFLFLAPEQFNRPETIDEVKRVRPSLFVVTRRTASAPGATTSVRTTCASAPSPTRSGARRSSR